jgi:1-acyl-sn-glycerol-3-phosphate acyltransferase
LAKYFDRLGLAKVGRQAFLADSALAGFDPPAFHRGTRTMNRETIRKPPRHWAPRLSPWWIRMWRPLTKHAQLAKERLLQIEVRGLEHLRQALAQGHGVLITPNHASHADCFAVYEPAALLDKPFYIMTAWQVFQRGNWIKRLALAHHGCFSVDREGTDLEALRRAVDLLASSGNPLVIFPEGEIYHCNERITPFREGPAAIALLAAKKASRPVVCIPCGIRYYYVDDPTPQLLTLMDALERRIYWRSRPDLALPQRIYRFAEGVLALKEVEYLGHASSGPLPRRIAEFTEFLLGAMEIRYGIAHADATVPERVKALRQYAIKRLDDLPPGDAARRQIETDLDDIFLVIQLFSYPGDYVAARPSIERMAETLDKFEEDVMEAEVTAIRGTRRATVALGEAIPVTPNRGKDAAASLTRLLESRVQALLLVQSAPA